MCHGPIRSGFAHLVLLTGGLLLHTACASTPHRIGARAITAAQWQDVVECVERNATTRETWVDRAEDGVRVGRNLPRGDMEEIWFRKGITGTPTLTVRSSAKVLDARNGREPMEGASPETRRFRQQLDAQCLSQYPLADTTGTTR